jgi:AraC family transcriptional regulator of adaptative response / DNA-3-methyladenine glycosylase II
MRALAWPDAFPESDLGILKALGVASPRLARERAEAWRPWRAYAVMHLWSSLENERAEGSTKATRTRHGIPRTGQRNKGVRP